MRLRLKVNVRKNPTPDQYDALVALTEGLRALKPKRPVKTTFALRKETPVRSVDPAPGEDRLAVIAARAADEGVIEVLREFAEMLRVQGIEVDEETFRHAETFMNEAVPSDAELVTSTPLGELAEAVARDSERLREAIASNLPVVVARQETVRGDIAGEPVPPSLARELQTFAKTRPWYPLAAWIVRSLRSIIKQILP